MLKGFSRVLQKPSRIMSSVNAMGKAPRKTVVTVENMNPHIRVMEYAVRGPIVARAGAIEKELKEGVKKPFPDVIRCNIGDAHAMGQSPITFIRQVVACATYPELLKSDTIPEDVKDRARRVLGSCRGSSVGSYSDSLGLEAIRRDVATYITERDGHPAEWTNCFLSNGASSGIKTLLKLMMTGENGTGRAGVMIPIPQYPLYSATNAEFNAYQIGYYLNEENHWGLDVSELKRSLDEARPHCKPRALVVINPGNPTGQVLPRKNIEAVIKFAKEEGLFLLADEVYQHNIYAEGAEFHSFKKVMTEMGGEYAQIELASFMSVSKGYMGECGFRAGYCEVINLDDKVRAMMEKMISANLCSTVPGQACMECVVNPPKPGEPSHELWSKERAFVLGELNKKAKMVSKLFNEIEGVSCNEVQGAMYAFPNIKLPPKAIQAAKEKGMTADNFFCFEFLENTGVCVVPGSGFCQRDGTYHFRTTILPPTEKIAEMLERFKKFHSEFIAKYQ